MAQKVGGPSVFPSARSLACTLLPIQGQASSLSRPNGTELSAPPKAALPRGRLVQPTQHQKAVKLLVMQSSCRALAEQEQRHRGFELPPHPLTGDPKCLQPPQNALFTMFTS